MYAMDHTMHTEHRPDERRHRWDLRRPATRATAPTTTPLVVTPRPEADSSPTHEFLD